MSFDDYGVTARDKPAKPATALFGVRGNVTGLEGERASVVLNGTSLEVTDGPFAFPATLADGVEFDVSVQDPPKHACASTGNKGKISGADATGVEIACVSRDVTLKALSLSVGPLSPAFDPAVRSYTVRVRTKGVLAADKSVPTTLTVSATPANPAARVSLSGVPLEAGMPSVPVVVKQGTHTLDIAVAVASAELHYTVAVTGEDFDYLKASDTAQWDAFGSGVAMSGNTLAVTSTGEPWMVGVTAGGPQKAAVYVFTRSASTWSQQAILPYAGPTAVDGDTIATSTAGGLAIYDRIGSSWVGQQLDTGLLSGFASGVALSGDTVAGVAFDFASSSFEIRIYARPHLATNWTQEALITRPSNNASPVLALSGDTLVIGDPGDASGATGINGDESDTSAPGSGAVSVFARTGTTWSRQAYVKPSSTRSNMSFGQAVGLAGDTLLVGCPGELDGGIPAIGVGAAYVFRRSGGVWAQEAILRGTPFARDRFGSAVALIADVAAIGAPDENLGSGVAYVFGRTGTTWTQRARVTPPGGARVRSGSSVAIANGVLAVGAPNESSNATGVNGDRTDHSLVASGAVFVH